jgi:hypothetical protein
VDPRVFLGHFGSATKIAGGRAARNVSRFFVESAEQPVPEEFGDAKIGVFVVEMVAELTPPARGP